MNKKLEHLIIIYRDRVKYDDKIVNTFNIQGLNQITSFTIQKQTKRQNNKTVFKINRGKQ